MRERKKCREMFEFRHSLSELWRVENLLEITRQELIKGMSSLHLLTNCETLVERCGARIRKTR